MELNKLRGHTMKNIIAGLLVLAVSTANAATFIPASDTHAAMSSQLIDFRTRTAQEISARAAAGYHYASVDMDGATWKEEKALMKELQALGYDVDFGNGHNVYGWNALNGALVIRWVPRASEPFFAPSDHK